MPGDLLFETLAGKGPAAGQALIEHTGQRINIGAGIDLPGAEALGGHVGPGADHRAGAGQPGLSDRVGDAEVDQIGEIVLVSRMLEGLTSRCTNPTRCAAFSAAAIWSMIAIARAGLKRPLGQQGLQVAALDQPHGHKQPAVDLAEVVDGDDVRLVQTRSRAGFAAEPLYIGRILGDIGAAAASAPPPDRWRCHRPATPRPCRRDPTTPPTGSAQTACPAPWAPPLSAPVPSARP